MEKVLIPNATYDKVSFVVTLGTTEPITDTEDIKGCVLDAISHELSDMVISGANAGFITEVSVTERGPDS